MPVASGARGPGSALGLRCPPLPVVRIGLIGLGYRGLNTLRRYAFVEGAELHAVADHSAEAVKQANALLCESGRPAAEGYSGTTAWEELCGHPDLDLIYICTDWASHARIAIAAMEAGKHVAVEVPAATTVEECFALVRTAERTQRHCFMTENCCYDWFSQATLHLRDTGFFGTITHCEGAYIHDWRNLFTHGAEGERTWYRDSCTHGGNPYPTHGIGPIAQLLEFHRKDRMLRLVSMTGQADGHDSLLGHANHTLITTERGVTILLQFDGTTPRPYSRLQGICGTKGFAQKYPELHVQTDHLTLRGTEAEAFLLPHRGGAAMDYWEDGRRKGVPNEMNYAMDMRLIHALRHGEALDIDVYDAAEWSCLAELTRRSAEQGGIPIDVPDFLR